MVGNAVINPNASVIFDEPFAKKPFDTICPMIGSNNTADSLSITLTSPSSLKININIIINKIDSEIK